jgi:Zn-dependent peptidase ImmA (M78 family)
VLRSQYYDQLKTLARDVRARFGLTTPRLLRSDLRRIYRAEGIRIDLWPYRFKGLRGAYFNDEMGPTVLLAKGLPQDPMVFTMAHELKHHLTDRGLSLSYCDASNQSNPIEIGAEIFAAELIYPDEDFAAQLARMGVQRGTCTPEILVRLKHETQTTLSYAGLAKRSEFMGFSQPGSLARVKWKKLEEQIYGPPIYSFYRRRRKH